MRSHEPRRIRARAVAHRCPISGCLTGCSPGHVLCRHHWQAIPEPERVVLRAAFRARTTDHRRYLEAVDLTARLAEHYAQRRAA